MSLFFAILIPILIALFIYLLRRPTNKGPWRLEQGVLPYATREGNLVTIHNIRTFEYYSSKSWKTRYETKTYDLNTISTIDYIIDDFGQGYNAAHAFASFGFKNGSHVSFSVEARRRPWQEYSPTKGLFRRYMLMYLVADESDIVKLRSVFWKDDVRVYPLRAHEDQIRDLFLSIVERMNDLRKHPEFYNTLTNACGSNLLWHANKVSKKSVRLSLPVVAPGASDKALYDAGLIDTDLSFEEARKYFLVNERAKRFKNDPDFSTRIREH